MNRIHFIKVPQSVSLTSILTEELQLSLSEVDLLISLGSIYCNFERVVENKILQSGDILRCHREPRRFPCSLDWSSRIVHEEDDFIVIDKPAGIPSQMTLDNCIENLHFQLSQFKKQNLFITHRLDMGTRGLTVLAKTKNFQTEFNSILERREVQKKYLALTYGELLPCSRIHHWMQPHPRSPKILSTQAIDGWKLCDLEIQSAEIKSGIPALYTPHFESKNKLEFSSLILNSSGNSEKLIEYSLQLHTGRTHQIRAQLSNLGNPLIGDSLYGGKPHTLDHEWHALVSSEISFNTRNKHFYWNLF